jgi:hypothetical protein
MTNDRIHHAQKAIQNELKAQPEYVLDTSEFHDVHDRLARLEDRRKGNQNPYLPVLRRRN